MLRGKVGSYPSLLEFVTLDNEESKKLNIACAPAEILLALFEDPHKALAFAARREELTCPLQGKVPLSEIRTAEEELRNQAASLVDASLLRHLDFSLSHVPKTIAVKAGNKVAVNKHVRTS